MLISKERREKITTTYTHKKKRTQKPKTTQSEFISLKFPANTTAKYNNRIQDPLSMWQQKLLL